MTLTRPDNTAVAALVAAIALLLPPACSSAPAGGGLKGSPTRAGDWGQNWAGGDEQGDQTAASPTANWTIVLATFAAPGHRQAAAKTVQQLPMVDPKLAGARVHTTPKGSLAVYGAYEQPDSPEAQADLAWIKQITIEGNPAFPQAMLTRIKLKSAGPVSPFDLRSARKRYPAVDPLYTLEVAIWSDFESGRLTLDQIHRDAERYASQLRAQGLEAYFFHDDDKRVSAVTIGLFDRTAIDSRTMIYSPELTALMKQFPARMVNGEPFNEPIDARRPSRGTRVQAPALVLVPME